MLDIDEQVKEGGKENQSPDEAETSQEPKAKKPRLQDEASQLRTTVGEQ